MVRKGIYVNGKEIVARYVGDKLVWRKTQSWTLVKHFTYTISYYNRESIDTMAKMNVRQYMGGSPPTLSSSDQYPDILNSAYGEYKIIFPYLNNLEFVLAGITITNTPRRRQNDLSALFTFGTNYERETFISAVESYPYFELYRKG